ISRCVRRFPIDTPLPIPLRSKRDAHSIRRPDRRRVFLRRAKGQTHVWTAGRFDKPYIAADSARADLTSRGLTFVAVNGDASAVGRKVGAEGLPRSANQPAVFTGRIHPAKVIPKPTRA